jgi:hypothetical protein
VVVMCAVDCDRGGVVWCGGVHSADVDHFEKMRGGLKKAGFGAFVSHFKREAQTDARVLKNLLEEKLQPGVHFSLTRRGLTWLGLTRLGLT